ncbi:hypothetical protein DICPUDRAFT_91186 [Dictyostelium purpureum]|uniref:BTB domain-containing protein n=1 Tax=Dictyostelium purpureum TaxID=5786 RepID=F0Z8R3_DICPU|nr:uncharacterized protein DICPUDRAFT_91186 [Dictyostelium purpureum]EGC39676.1 hypothetical protein DICPUDRAFT_91186 [Dictyostelium purpureum]|eukprot:XP_003283785.1 hypothetical protein DICPUDRAFT_91186 [Dictyostelium purpureum]
MMSEGIDDSDPVSEAVGFISNILTDNPETQYQGLKGLMLCPTVHVVELFKNPDYYYHIKKHPNHKHVFISPSSSKSSSSPANSNNSSPNNSNNSSPTHSSSPPTNKETNNHHSPHNGSQCSQCSPNGSPKYSEIDFDKISKKRKSNIKSLIELCLSETKKVQSSALRLLWHLSAQADLKVLLFEEGVLDKLKYLMFSDIEKSKDEQDKQSQIHRTEVQLASSAILQNITEYRFEKGEINPNQVKIVNENIVELILIPRSKSSDKRIQFLTTLTIANLSMNEENHSELQKCNAFDLVERFVISNSIYMDLVCHWITLQPHIPLLHSKYYQVQLFALYCLYNLMRNDQYKVEVWKSLSVNNGVQSIFYLLHSPHGKVVELARKIADQLQIEEPSVTVNTTKIGTDLRKLFNNQEYSDITFVCEGKKLYAHKAICASRCEQLRAMFTWGKESKENEITLPDIPYLAMYGVLEYIYCGIANITWENACDLLQWADYFSLSGLKSSCEFYLWHYIDTDNAPIILTVADRYRCTQLRNVASNFVIRNWEKIKDSEVWVNQVSQDVKNFINEKIYSLITCSCGCICSCVDDVNNKSSQSPQQTIDE